MGRDEDENCYESFVRRRREKVGTESWYESMGEEIGRKGESGIGRERYKGASFVSLHPGM